MAKLSLICVALMTISVVYGAVPPCLPLKNAASPNSCYPFIGLGTGGYGLNGSLVYPECWIDNPPGFPGCGAHTTAATKAWLQMGGVRLDNANSYYNEDSFAQGIIDSGVDRSQIFITSKVGPSNPLGYNDTLSQMKALLLSYKVSYVDLLLIHWPTYAPSELSPVEPVDPACNTLKKTYNEVQCRLNTWKAMVEIFQAGGAKAIGVSNYNTSHLQEIIDAGMPLPSVNQCPFHVHRSSSQMDLVHFCQSHDIAFNAYSPLGVPDLAADVAPSQSFLLHKFPAPMTASILDEPILKSIAAAHQRSPAQIIINWLWAQNIPTNPRSMNPSHMTENLNSFDFTLTPAEMQALSNMPQDYCSIDNWYECV